jgi:hypothetical protein
MSNSMIAGKSGFWGGVAAMITGCCNTTWVESLKPMFEEGNGGF